MSERLKILLVYTALFAVNLPISTSAETSRPPNIILVMTDDQGYGDLACTGNPLLKTPSLDAFYAKSLRLKNFHVSPTCAPTRGALMCGQVTDKAGSWHTINGRDYLRKEKITLPQVLGQNGYSTALFGKWHLGDNYPYRPHDRGFQHALYHGGGGVGQTPDYFGNKYFDDTYFENGTPKKFKGYCTDVWFSEALAWMEKQKDAPFFIYIAPNAPHSPHIVEDKYRDLYPESYQGKKVPREFYGMITNIDENFAKLCQKLEELHLMENTILIFTTDNGSAAGADIYNANMRGKKNSDADGGHRVPFFMHWPKGNLQGGKDLPELTAHVDVMPTLLAMAGLAFPKTQDQDGLNLWPLIKGESWPERMLFTDSQRVYIPKKWRGTAVMNTHFRLLNNGTELYKMDTDPRQEKNVISQFPEMAKKLSDYYDLTWKNLEPSFLEPTHIIVGSEFENPTVMTAHDWRGDLKDNEVPWDQVHIEAGLLSNGYWEFECAKDGLYQFTFSRWPREIQRPITQGKGFSKANNIRVKIKAKTMTESFDKDAGEVSFTVPMSAGLAKCEAEFLADQTPLGGAYYSTITYKGP